MYKTITKEQILESIEKIGEKYKEILNDFIEFRNLAERKILPDYSKINKSDLETIAYLADSTVYHYKKFGIGKNFKRVIESLDKVIQASSTIIPHRKS